MDENAAAEAEVAKTSTEGRLRKNIIAASITATQFVQVGADSERSEKDYN
jgi:hypothetical protein